MFDIAIKQLYVTVIALLSVICVEQVNLNHSK